MAESDYYVSRAAISLKSVSVCAMLGKVYRSVHCSTTTIALQ